MVDVMKWNFTFFFKYLNYLDVIRVTFLTKESMNIAYLLKLFKPFPVWSVEGPVRLEAVLPLWRVQSN